MVLRSLCGTANGAANALTGSVADDVISCVAGDTVDIVVDTVDKTLSELLCFPRKKHGRLAKPITESRSLSMM